LGVSPRGTSCAEKEIKKMRKVIFSIKDVKKDGHELVHVPTGIRTTLRVSMTPYHEMDMAKERLRRRVREFKLQKREPNG
jgi:hypothetical protein